MDNTSEPVSLFSSRVARTLHLIMIAGASVLLASNLWLWTSGIYAWTTLFGSVGMLLLAASFPMAKSRVQLYFVLQAIALSLLIADLILIFKSR